MAERQFATPLILRKGKCTELSRVPVTDRRVDEDWLQELLFKHPRLLPLHEIEGLFGDSIPVVRELPTEAGSIDLLYVNSHGHLTIVETKLWRNPEATTHVVAQIIKYASALARWSYEELVDAVRKAGLTRGKDPLLDLAKGVYGSKFDQGEFRSQVKESLRLGRFLLLIVGDHIREDLEDLTEFLEQTPRLGFTLALVEIALFREDPKADDVLFVQPRIVARTREVTRAVVEIKVPIDPANVDVTIKEDDGPPRARRYQDHLEKLGENTAPGQALEMLKNKAEQTGGRIDEGRAYVTPRLFGLPGVNVCEDNAELCVGFWAEAFGARRDQARKIFCRHFDPKNKKEFDSVAPWWFSFHNIKKGTSQIYIKRLVERLGKVYEELRKMK